MRILLAAANAAKGDLEGNLARHLATLEQARAQGCQLAVFPEFSLTGSVDPRTHPGRTVAVDDPAVRAVLAATSRTGVAALFGIAERDGQAFHIAQLYGHDGRLGGVYRKRHLAEDEAGYRPGHGSGVFQLGAARFGVAICAEGGVDFPWDDAAAGGASVVCFCSAPGLYGRRTDERGWRDGYGWWLSAGLGDALRHARRLGVPVAMTTQAGSTEDEDFPGLAALVSVAGEVARLPDWREGSLVVEAGADVTVHPVREAVRCLLVDQAGRALLVRYADHRVPHEWWGAPGGGLDAGEDHLAAVRRELREELDRDDLEVGPWIGRRCHTFWLGRWMTQRERWVLCRAEPFEVAPAHVATLAAEAIAELRWWSADELRAEAPIVTPRDLPELLDRIARGDLPGPDDDLGV
ncbi:MAG TPA: nitrilase-related carbon-nitrogen hydrolase [Actinomycetes bacterium]|nr:nitrilase-related carbon-nitrogen hydrolase [Actinomycetes bacterium]